jgi:hypothetical protein
VLLVVSSHLLVVEGLPSAEEGKKMKKKERAVC